MTQHRGLIRPYGVTVTVARRLVDAACIVGAHAAAVALYEGHAWTSGDALVATPAALLFSIVGDANGLYGTTRGVRARDEVMRIWSAWIVVIPVLLFAAFVTKVTSEYSRVVTLSWFVAAPAAISLWRYLARAILGELRRRGRNSRVVAIAGITELSEELARRIEGMPWLGLRLDGIYDDRAPERCPTVDADVARVEGHFDELVDRAKRGLIDVVYVTLPLRAESRVHDLADRLADTTADVYLVPDFYVFDLLHGSWSSLDDIPVVSIHEAPFDGVDGWLKRLEDLVLGTVFLALAAVPMMLIALAIKLTSRGPVFFRQRRYGLNGEVIEVLKFRTMTTTEDGADVHQATKDDARITRIGALLRRTSLDELPQLVHVVTGRMSLVGPRPHAVAHNEFYRERIRGYMMRHKVKPGLTGWAQVNGWRGETDVLWKMEKRIEYDLEYIHRWGILFDLEIVFLTIFGRAVHRNEY